MGHLDSEKSVKGRATLARHGPVSVTSLSWCQSRAAEMKPTSKRSATGRHDDLKCFSLLAARCRREIETILKTVGQDSNLQPRLPPTWKQSVSADMRTVGRNWERWRLPAEPLRAKLRVLVCLWGAALFFFWVAARHVVLICSHWEKYWLAQGSGTDG